MLVFLCALPTLFSARDVLPRRQGPASVFSQVIPEPTGLNAYEDYAQAADMVLDLDFQVYLNWQTERYPQYKESYDSTMASESTAADQTMAREQLDLAAQLKDLNFLQVQSEMVQWYQPALDLVRSGLRKNVWQPRKQFDANTLFPELKGFKMLERLFLADAYVQFADGRADMGTQDLVDGLRFAEHQPTGPLIGSLVATAMDSLAFAGMQRNMSRISLEGWKDIAEICEKHLADNTPLTNALKLDRQMLDNTLAEAAENPNGIKALLQNAQVTPPNIPQAEGAKLFQDVRSSADQIYSEAIQRFSGPEADWAIPPASWSDAPQQIPPNPTYSDLLAALVDSITLDFSSLGNTFSRARTQWRILRLHALIQAFRWEEGRLPGDILEAATLDDLEDPLSGKKLVYARLDSDRYRLYSSGSPQVGEVDLIYHKPVSVPTSHQ